MDSDSTTEDLPAAPSGRVGRWSGRAGILLLGLLVAGGLTGAIDTHVRTATDEGGGYELEVDYYWVARAGQPAPLHVRVAHPGGFPGKTVTIELCDALFDALDFQNWYPNPSAEVGGDRLAYEFDSPPGEMFEVSLDARVAPGDLGGHDSCRIAVLLEGESVASVEFESWRLP